MAVAAADIAPKAFEQLVKEGGEHQDVEDDLQFDLRNLLVVNPHQVDEQALADDSEEYLKGQAQAAVQSLINRLFVLPTVPSEVGPVATLPAKEESILPRAKPVPAPKAETRWDRFAKEKGITGSKRSRMVWDDDLKEWRPRHGYKRANDGVLNHAIVEVKPGKDPMANPWSEAREEKKGRVEKNLSNRAKNVERAGGGAKPGIPVDLLPSAKDGSGGGGAPAKRGKANTKGALELVQHSTASMGKFDERRHAEPERRKGKGVRRAFKPVTVGSGEETQGHLKILNSVMIGKSKSADKDGTARSAKESLAAYDAIEGPRDAGAKRKKGKGASGKAKKVTKGRAK
ncbi:Ribosome biogenesis regulatory protein homolog [Ectocarpus siliculosus]|uniref:Ribosome biogenesis regulatory protein n=1 Tax=Ectocarpus siliculosus TaxID=2880 RepID=D7FMN3_ECTSI|nr:Ribosome biogenesis regulatory protein homolog [Ectocarpus siliculosus]|eukprot:CBJ25930.1 Ribosome biogenesis regulatory protein homolog [Ectocarpus siliculosus]